MRKDILLVGPLPPAQCYGGGIPVNLMAQLKQWRLPASVEFFNNQLWAREKADCGRLRLDNVLAFFINGFRLTLAMIRCRPAIVHFHTNVRLALLKDAFLASGVRWLGRSRVVLHIHFSEADAILLTRSPFLRRLQLRLLLFSADRIVFLSNNVIDALARMLPLKSGAQLKGKAFILPVFTNIPADTDHRPQPDSPVRIFFIGNVGQRKGVFDLIRAAGKMREMCATPFQIVLAGAFDSPTVKEQLTQLVDDQRLRDRITFLGLISDAEKDRMFRQADIFTLPSYGEGVPLAALEAMSYGLPLVVTNVGGIPENIQDGREGFVISPGDQVALAAVLARLVESPELRLTMGLTGLARAREFYSIDAFFTALHTLYASLRCLPKLTSANPASNLSAGRKA